MTEASGRDSGRTLVEGRAEGTVLLLDEPLSFWGGMDPRTGVLTDARHPQRGAVLTGRVLAMPSGRGSSSSSTVLAEAVRAGTAPAAILLADPDPIVALGALVAGELYGRSPPVVAVNADAYGGLTTGDRIRVEAHPGGTTLRPA